ncbi:hypothetical protein Dimus_039802 [Dionaea muscipula]
MFSDFSLSPWLPYDVEEERRIVSTRDCDRICWFSDLRLVLPFNALFAVGFIWVGMGLFDGFGCCHWMLLRPLVVMIEFVSRVVSPRFGFCQFRSFLGLFDVR